MKPTLSFLAIIFTLFFSSFAKADAKECIELQKIMSYPKGTQLSPIPENTTIYEVSPVDMFRFASGYYCDVLRNIPAIYASQLPNSEPTLTVVGPGGFEMIFALKDSKTAFQQYLILLKQTKYLK